MDGSIVELVARTSRLCSLLLLWSSCTAVPQAPPDGLAPLDSPTLQFQDRLTSDRSLDRAAPDAAADRGSTGDGLGPKDRGATVDKPPLSPCLMGWTAWSCGPSPIPLGCAAQCSDYVLTCVPGLPLAPQVCTCQHGGKQKTCTGDGVNCDACKDARKSCCQF